MKGFNKSLVVIKIEYKWYELLLSSSLGLIWFVVVFLFINLVVPYQIFIFLMGGYFLAMNLAQIRFVKIGRIYDNGEYLKVVPNTKKSILVSKKDITIVNRSKHLWISSFNRIGSLVEYIPSRSKEHDLEKFDSIIIDDNEYLVMIKNKSDLFFINELSSRQGK